MNALAKADIVAKTLEVFRMVMGDRYTVLDACNIVGISPRQYYHWLRSGDDTIQEIRDAIAKNEREQLAEILSARQITIQKLVSSIEQIRSTTDLIAVDRHLLDLQRELEDRHGAHGVSDSAAEEFLLRGPHRVKHASRTGARVNIKQNPDGSIDVTLPKPKDEIVDGEFLES